MKPNNTRCAELRCFAKKSFRTVEKDRERVAAFRNVAEMADAAHSKSRDQRIVWVWAALPAAQPLPSFQHVVFKMEITRKIGRIICFL